MARTPRCSPHATHAVIVAPRARAALKASRGLVEAGARRLLHLLTYIPAPGLLRTIVYSATAVRRLSYTKRSFGVRADAARRFSNAVPVWSTTCLASIRLGPRVAAWPS
jgi:hypothetical protein